MLVRTVLEALCFWVDHASVHDCVSNFLTVGGNITSFTTLVQLDS